MCITTGTDIDLVLKVSITANHLDTAKFYGNHAMVRRIGTSAAAAQLQLTARPIGRKWSPELNCRPITNCAAAPPARSAHQVGSSRWPRAGGGAEIGAADGPGRLCLPAGRVTLTNPPI